jgi:CheY-like chemotaxis protein
MRPASLPEPADRKTDIPPGRKTVLVVDDEDDFRSMVRDLLGIHGFNVIEARDGIEALALLRNFKVAVVLTDLYMWRMDGMELIRQLQKATRQKPGVIAVTGAVHIGHQSSATAAGVLGAHEVLMKPFTANQLLDSLNRVLALSA